MENGSPLFLYHRPLISSQSLSEGPKSVSSRAARHRIAVIVWGIQMGMWVAIILWMFGARTMAPSWSYIEPIKNYLTATVICALVGIAVDGASWMYVGAQRGWGKFGVAMLHGWMFIGTLVLLGYWWNDLTTIEHGLCGGTDSRSSCGYNIYSLCTIGALIALVTLVATGMSFHVAYDRGAGDDSVDEDTDVEAGYGSSARKTRQVTPRQRKEEESESGDGLEMRC